MTVRLLGRSAAVCLFAAMLAGCDSGSQDGPMTMENADLTGRYAMLPLEDSDDPFVTGGTIVYRMTNVVIHHDGGQLFGTGSCRWTFTPDDPLGAPLTQLGDAALTGSYDRGSMELSVAGSYCPEGAFAGTWTNPDTLVFDLGAYFDDDAPLVLVLEEAGN